MSWESDVSRDKRAARARFRVERSALSAATRAGAAEAIAALAASLAPGTFAAYVPIGTEPGSVSMLQALAGRVLLPVTPPEPGPLDWAEFGELVPGAYGLLEPAGPRLGVDALTSVDTVLLPALAVARSGVRLGRGAGYYDRSLSAARPDARLIAVVYDHELVDSLPADELDVPVHGALTPSGLVWL